MNRVGRLLALLTLLALAGATAGDGWRQGGLVAGAHAQEAGQVPGGTLGNRSDPDFWRAIRQGDAGHVAGGGPDAGVMIQSEGDQWRAFRNGPLTRYGAYALAAIILLLALFLAIRGRVRIVGGPSGRTVTRFNGIERFGHWLTALTFIVLALSGLNMLYGRVAILPVVGPQVFHVLTEVGKTLHNSLAFGFMVGLALIFVLWVWHNLPSHHDIVWVLKGGGILKAGTHPPSKKFNAGQKLVFWLVVLGGSSLSLSGLMLLFPFQYEAFGPTFGWVNWAFGTDWPTQLTAMQEMQLAQLWHAIVGIGLIVVVIAHIYIGSIGMEGAFDAMGTGEVDLNWAREHHNLWVEKLERKGLLNSDD